MRVIKITLWYSLLILVINFGFAFTISNIALAMGCLLGIILILISQAIIDKKSRRG
jgi:hypothetical protein|nr:MAG TPA: holin [Bacteriophage sp.]